MTTRTDSENAGRDAIAEQRRRRVGHPPTTPPSDPPSGPPTDPPTGPPSDRELDAYMRGELNAEEEERIRELLVTYPELARVVGADFPEDDPRPGEPGYVSDEEIARRLAAFHERMETAAPAEQKGTAAPAEQKGGRVLPFRSRVPFAVAAALALVFAGLWWQAQSRIRRLEHDLTRPRAVSMVELRRGAQRGGDGSITLENLPEDMQREVAILMSDMPHYDSYAVDIVDATETVVGSVERVRRTDDVARITMPRLRSGRYSIHLYGFAGSTRELLEKYPVRVP